MIQCEIVLIKFHNLCGCRKKSGLTHIIYISCPQSWSNDHNENPNELIMRCAFGFINRKKKMISYCSPVYGVQRMIFSGLGLQSEKNTTQTGRFSSERFWLQLPVAYQLAYIHFYLLHWQLLYTTCIGACKMFSNCSSDFLQLMLHWVIFRCKSGCSWIYNRGIKKKNTRASASHILLSSRF